MNWLRDAKMLPADITNARIMSWGYDANTHSTKELSAMYLYDHAQNLVSDLSLHRRTDKVDNSLIIIDCRLRLLTTMVDRYTAHHFRCPQSRRDSSKERMYVVSDQVRKAYKPSRLSFTPTLHDPIICIITNPSRRLHMASCSWVLLTKEARV